MARAALIVTLLAAWSSLAIADDDAPAPARRTPFDRGRFGLSLGGGTTSAFGHPYYAIGGGLGYYVLDGVEIAASGLVQFGSSPNIEKVSPSLRYVAQPLVGKSPIIPYVGTFYTHWFVGGGFGDVDTIGGRVGGLYVSGQIILGLGLAYERIESACTMNCDAFYPDFTIAFAL
jgi:hypothetical protein